MMPIEPDFPLMTDRLRLRPFRRGDLDAVFAYRQREDVARYLFDQPLSRQACADAIHEWAGQVILRAEGDRLVLAAERRADNQLLGEVMLNWRNAAARQGEIGYIFNPDFGGQGYATEAALALAAFGFDTLRLHRIYGRCDARNLPSARVMERLGMRREAHFRHHAIFKGDWDEELVFAILEDEWRARN